MLLQEAEISLSLSVLALPRSWAQDPLPFPSRSSTRLNVSELTIGPVRQLPSQLIKRNRHQEPNKAWALQLVANVGADPWAQLYLPLGQYKASTEAAMVTAQAE